MIDRLIADDNPVDKSRDEKYFREDVLKEKEEKEKMNEEREKEE